MLFAHIAFPVPIDKLFSYRIPDHLQPRICAGARVLAPFGKKKITGFVVQLSDSSDVNNPSFLTEMLDSFPVFSDELLELARWMAEYYMTPLGQVLNIMLPPRLDKQSEIVINLKKDIGEFEIASLRKSKPLQARILKALFVYKHLTVKQLQKKTETKAIAKSLKELEHLGIIEYSEKIDEADVSVRYEKFVTLSEALVDEPERIQTTFALLKGSPKQAKILRFLSKLSDREIKQSDLLKATHSTLGSLQSLEEKKWIKIFEKEKVRNPYDRPFAAPIPITLNAEQQSITHKIAEAIHAAKYQTFLLHGITGSGKTQIYIEAIKKTLEAGKTAIVLVPEISLTPQAVERFKSHFGEQVAVWHSRMSLGERFDAWRKIHTSDFKIVIGARSAIFAPLKNLGLIVVDEEHENTYKQSDSTPKYHARDVAIIRATLNHSVVILGSATPSIESFYNAQTDKYRLVQLTKRIQDVPLPEVEIVDLRKEKLIHTEGWEPVLSKPLRDRIREAVQKNHQVILYQNRRGFATFIECYQCGFVAECPRCSITLTYHASRQILLCHYCGHKQAALTQCPECANSFLSSLGVGTQKVEEVLKQTFPETKTIRMDLDTTTQKGSHERILEKFRSNEAQILLGTQMVAKGLDFENVTVVGVISADTSLLLPDFRASERTFQLLTQVAGRAGRKNKLGKVVIQTFNPNRPAIKHARMHDYLSFYQEEIGFRKELNYPPFTRLTSILLRSLDEKKVVDHSRQFCDILRNEASKHAWPQHQFDILGPTGAPILKIRNYFRWYILIKTSKKLDRSGVLTREVIKKTLLLYNATCRDSKVEVVIEMDPHSLL
ncbi:primosomal protein N' [bacterium]|nr:primosomal protein N' [bacterium]